jgi:hypothetical protein
MVGGDSVGVRVPGEVDEGCVIMEVAVGLIPLSVLIVELQAVVKNNSNKTRRIDSNFCCSISTSIKNLRMVLNLPDEAHPIFPRTVMIWIISYAIPNSLSWHNLETHMGMKSNRGCVNG